MVKQKKLVKKRQSLRELYHMQDHGDAVAGALERKDIGTALSSLSMLRGLIRGSIEREEGSIRRSDEQVG